MISLIKGKYKCSNINCNNRVQKRGYCKECKKLYNKHYREQHLSNYIYCLLDDKENILYLGSTNNLYRINCHLTNNSHLNIDSKKWIYTFCFDNAIYCEIENINRDELFFIEKLLIQRKDPPLNSCILPNFDEKQLIHSKEELLNIANNLKFINYKVDKDYLLKKIS